MKKKLKEVFGFGMVMIISLLLISFSMQSYAYAARIHGSVYDYSLEKVNNAIVEINTTPEQRFVAVNGDYNFFVPEGSYRIVAKYYKNNLLELYGEESIEVGSEGDFVLDIILFPPEFKENLIDEEIVNLTEEAADIGIEEELFSGLELEGGKEKSWFKSSTAFLGVFIAVLVLIIAGIISLYFLRKRSRESLRKEELAYAGEELDSELEKVVKILKEAGGRATQKEIRLKLNCSDAKLSLMLAELEDKGVIKKIKKGRGNIIILRREDKRENFKNINS